MMIEINEAPQKIRPFCYYKMVDMSSEDKQMSNELTLRRRYTIMRSVPKSPHLERPKNMLKKEVDDVLVRGSLESFPVHQHSRPGKAAHGVLRSFTKTANNPSYWQTSGARTRKANYSLQLISTRQ
jgi:hypothetical protein